MINQNIIFSQIQQKYENKLPEEYYTPDDRWDSIWYILDDKYPVLYKFNRIHDIINKLLDKEIEEIDEKRVYKRKLSVDEIVKEVEEYVNN